MKLLYFVILIFLSCNENPIHKGKKSSELNIDYVFTRNISSNSAEIVWSCSDKAEGFISYGISGTETILKTPFINRFHFMKLNQLQDGTRYRFQVSCRIKETKTSVLKYYRFETFTTIAIPQPPAPNPPLIAIARGIWIVGGIGNNGLPVAQIDLYDPVIDTWYPNVTSVPTPRSYASISQVNGKIYIIGGISVNQTTFVQSMTNIVEEYNTSTNSWRSSTNNLIAPAPTIIQGSLSTNVADSIYLLAGSSDVLTTSALNSIYRFTPELGTMGTWSGVIFTIPFRLDYSGCAIDGTIIFSNGRDSTGVQQTASDGFVVGANTLTSLAEANSSQGRFGVASVCYKPRTTDPFPGDAPSLFSIGGSRTPASSTIQPPSSITATNRFDYYLPQLNTIQVGTLPFNLYAPAAEVSYDTRKLYVFGGSSTINVPLNLMHSIDISNPIAATWITTTIPANLPVRFGHKALLLNR